MSFTTPQALSKDTATDVDTNLSSYVLQAADIGKSIFSVAGLTLPNAKLLTISHETDSKGNQRHLARLDRTEVDALLVPATLSTYVVMVRPPSTAITNAICIEEVNKLVDFLVEGGTNANVTALLNNEV
jgi:hypothetical protein